MAAGMSITLVEDEIIIAEYLRSILEKKGHEVNVLFSGNDDFAKHLEDYKPDLVFLDINLDSEKSGIDLAGMCQQRGVPFIYLTSYSDTKTIESAMRFDPVAYILKPFTEEEVHKTLNIARIKLAKSKGNFLKLKDGYNLIKIRHQDIMWLKADNVYTEIKTEQKKYVQRIGLSEINELLPEETFLRVHRSYIVNMGMVDGVGSDHLELKGEKIPIGRSKKAEIFTRFNQ
jgi:DNA-binding LytR/AlgR family response regulator|tara:strand:+ start:5006 stop:5695 length:690 start_codon:yes stop_codon:yes gene_type:complete